MKVELGVSLHDFIEIRAVAGVRQYFPVQLLEHRYVRRFGALRGQLGGDALQNETGLDQVAHGAETHLRNQVSAPRDRFEQLLVVEAIASLAKGSPADAEARQDVGLGKKSSFGELTAENSLLEDAVGLFGERAASVGALTISRHDSNDTIYSGYIVDMKLVPPYIAAMEPYVPGLAVDDVRRLYGLERAVKLSSNENPLGPSPLALEAMKATLGGVSRYPDGGFALRRKLAERFGVKVENVIAGAGSEGIMADIVRTFLGDDEEVLSSEGTFAGMRVLAQSRGVAFRTVPLRDWRFDLDAIAGAITDKTKLIYLANPNNPTGTIFSRSEFGAFHRHVPAHVLVILDEAYFEYAQDNPAYPDSMHYRWDNVITLRTFSKAYGLAAARIGYGFAHEDLIAMLLKVKLPFAPSTLASAAGIAGLDDREFLHRTLEINASGMRRMMAGLLELGLVPVPSEANFVMVPFATRKRAAEVFEELLRQGVIVRPLDSYGLPLALRITIGTTEENELCLQALQHALRLEPALR